jgi:hypothetical protein
MNPAENKYPPDKSFIQEPVKNVKKSSLYNKSYIYNIYRKDETGANGERVVILNRLKSLHWGQIFFLEFKIEIGR